MTNTLIILGVSMVLVYTILLNIILYQSIKMKFKPVRFPKKTALIRLFIMVAFTFLMILSSITGTLVLFFYVTITILGLFNIIRYRVNLSIWDYLISIFLGMVIALIMYESSISWRLINGITTTIGYLAGVGLLKAHNLTHLFILNKDSFKKVGIGMLIVIPPSILNAFANFDDAHIKNIWYSFYALKPAIHEEILMRLFLMTYIMTIGRKANSTKNTALPVLYASVMVSILFSLLHGFHPVNSLILMVLFSLPLCFIYLRFGIVAAIGAHFITDFIRYISTFL